MNDKGICYHALKKCEGVKQMRMYTFSNIAIKNILKNKNRYIYINEESGKCTNTYFVNRYR